MYFFERLENFSVEELRQLAGLCSGTALLILVVLIFSGDVPVLTNSLGLALENLTAQPAAAAAANW